MDFALSFPSVQLSISFSHLARLWTSLGTLVVAYGSLCCLLGPRRLFASPLCFTVTLLGEFTARPPEGVLSGALLFLIVYHVIMSWVLSPSFCVRLHQSLLYVACLVQAIPMFILHYVDVMLCVLCLI